MERLIPLIIQSPNLHLRWLNTLSYLENCGARKLAAYEHPILVREEMLKHAAEEFRHAYILKKQMLRIGEVLPTYERRYLLGGWDTVHYLDKLEVAISRFLKGQRACMAMAYPLIIYAIEKRAEKIYPLYESILRKAKSPIGVKSILLEEQGHLQEIEGELALYKEAPHYANHTGEIEQSIYNDWLITLQNEILIYYSKSAQVPTLK